MRSLLLIVLYNKEIRDSQTVVSLLKTNYAGELLIFNNGPKSILQDNAILNTLKSKYERVYFEEDVSNRPLSVMYNDVLLKEGYDEYFLFDDDTSLPIDFFDIEKDKSDIVIPLIKNFSNEEVFYPLVNGKVEYTLGILKNSDYVLSVGSGLMLSKSLVDKFLRNNLKPFDERFSLYGVDFSLFRRIDILKSLGEQVYIKVYGRLNHSLSRIDEKTSKWREIERLTDKILTKIHYSKRSPIVTYSHIAFIVLQKICVGDITSAKIILKLIKSKCHPRSEIFKSRW